MSGLACQGMRRGPVKATARLIGGGGGFALAPVSPGRGEDGGRGAAPALAGDHRDGPPQPRLPRRHRGAQANQAHLPRGVIAKTFLSAKTFRAPGTNFLRQEKSLRDHGDAAGPTDVIRRRATALMPHQSP